MTYNSFDEERIIYLLSKRLQQKLSDDEEYEIRQWREASDKNRLLFEQLTDEQSVRPSVEKMQQYDAEPAIGRWKTHIAIQKRQNKRRYYAFAASIALLLSIGIIWNDNRQRFDAVMEADITPGRNKAHLILADGSVLSLDSLPPGATTDKAGIQITKTANGKVSCSYLQTNADIYSTPTYNTISTPLGGEYQIVLPDGSNVWLNANSSLRFPSRFPEKKRVVELLGEAYFEIAAKANAPFVVSTTKQTIQVLGTKFNIRAYKEDKMIRTTLLEGSVQVHTASHKQLIQPGQEARTYFNDDNLEVVSGDVNEAVAWKNGYFIFNDESIVDIMTKVSRWYNVDVVYEGNVKRKIFAGTFSKKKSLRKLLESFASTEQISYKIEGRRVTIMSE
ncbi:MAG TPA: FecR domain-containing protein [Pseudosphingobacterium sp.]|nr:FecR domain-containing protein [Pseudosphingobacterium sp.]